MRVTLAARDAAVEMVVADQGPGVAPENRARLFRRYARGEEADEPGVGGLGLSVVAWVTERHGGQVRLLDSSSGAAFQIILPSMELANDVSAAHETEPMSAGQ